MVRAGCASAKRRRLLLYQRQRGRTSIIPTSRCSSGTRCTGFPGCPCFLPAYRVHSIELWVAAVSKLTGLEAINVAHLILPALGGDLLLSCMGKVGARRRTVRLDLGAGRDRGCDAVRRRSDTLVQQLRLDAAPTGKVAVGGGMRALANRLRCRIFVRAKSAWLDSPGRRTNRRHGFFVDSPVVGAGGRGPGGGQRCAATASASREDAIVGGRQHVLYPGGGPGRPGGHAGPSRNSRAPHCTSAASSIVVRIGARHRPVARHLPRRAAAHVARMPRRRFAEALHMVSARRC